MSESLECPTCGTSNSMAANFCEDCGSDLRPLPGPRDETSDVAVSQGETVTMRPAEAQPAPAELSGEHSIAFKTDIGYSHHVNQDAGGAWSWTRPDGIPVGLLVVADGVSAGRHSEAASRLAVEVIYGRLAPLLPDPEQRGDALLRALMDAAREANHQVAQRPHHSLSSADATTLVCAFCLGSRGAGVWCGDSRVYCIGENRVTQLTRDHSWAEGVISHGLMSAEDAAHDPRARMITRWLGPPDQDDPGLETFHFRLGSGDMLLCCTDGLYMYFTPPNGSETEIERVLAEHRGDLQAGVDELVEIALQRGGRDNLTAAVIQITGDVPEEEWEPEEAAGNGMRLDETVRLTLPVDQPPGA